MMLSYTSLTENSLLEYKLLEGQDCYSHIYTPGVPWSIELSQCLTRFSELTDVRTIKIESDKCYKQ